MKKFWMMMLAAATLVGCQKSEDMTISTGNTISLTAEMSQPETSRTALVENEGVYSAIWTSGDKLTLFELADGAFSLYESNALSVDAETASFTFDGVVAKEAASFRYVAGTNITSNCTVNNIRFELPAEQAPATMNTFDGAADILLSLPIDRATQPVSEALTFTTARVSTVVKLAIKNLALADGEKVEQVVFSCEQPISGKFQVGVKNLAADTYPIPFGWRDEGYSISVTLPEAQSDDFVTYFSCLPATLKAGESYTVTVKTNQATYHKVATLPADLTLTAGDITSVAVNMGDATTETPITRFNDAYEYVIACKMADGKTYLMDRTPTAKNPAAVEATSLGLTIDNTTGVIAGQIPNKYRWRAKSIATETDGVYSAEFYYKLMGVTYNLIATSNAQGLAINSELAGAQNNPYVKELTVKTKGNGYAIMNTTGGASMYVNTTQGQFRFTAEHSDVVYFYRVNLASMKENEVIDQSTDLPAGTYAVLYKHTDGKYYALPNETNISGEEGSYTAAHPATGTIADAGITLNEDGTVASADVPNRFKWVITKRGTTTAYDFRSAVNMTHFLYMRSGATIAIGPHAIVNAVNDNYQPDWHLTYSSANGIQGQVTGSTRYLYCNSTVWAAANNTNNGSLVFVYLSPSTEQIVTE